jgi:WD40 repeat protein
MLLAGSMLALLAVLALLAPFLTRFGAPPDRSNPDDNEKSRPLPKGVWVPAAEELASRLTPADALKRADIAPDLLAAAGRGNPAGAPKELVAILADHKGPVQAVAMAPDSMVLASCAQGDPRIRWWNLGTGKLLRTLPALPQPPSALAFNPDGLTFAAASENSGEITLWDLEKGKQVGSLPPQGKTVAQLAYSIDSKFLAFRLVSGVTKLYEIGTKKLRTIEPAGAAGDGCVSFSPDNKTLATGGPDKILRLWDAETGKEQATLTGAEDVIRWVGFQPAGRSVAFSGAPQDHLIHHWGLAPRAEKPALSGHTSGVLSAAWRADGKMLVSAGLEDGTVRLWDPDANPPRCQTIVLFPPGQGSLRSIALTPEGRYLATGNSDGTISVLRLAPRGTVFAP